MEIIEGIYRADEASGNLAHSNVYFVVNGTEVIVVDTGTAGNAKKILSAIEKIGRKPSDVSTIVLTHYHMDHSGSAKDLKAATNAKLAVHTYDAEVVEGKKPYPKAKNLLMRAASSFVKVASTQVDIQLKDGDSVGDLRVIHTPGHSPGSIMLFDMARKVIFSGDTLRLEKGKVAGAPRFFTLDKTKEWESIQRVAKLDFDVLLPGHGEYLVGNASAAVQMFAASLNKP